MIHNNQISQDEIMHVLLSMAQAAKKYHNAKSSHDETYSHKRALALAVNNNVGVKKTFVDSAVVNSSPEEPFVIGILAGLSVLCCCFFSQILATGAKKSKLKLNKYYQNKKHEKDQLIQYISKEQQMQAQRNTFSDTLYSNGAQNIEKLARPSTTDIQSQLDSVPFVMRQQDTMRSGQLFTPHTLSKNRTVAELKTDNRSWDDSDDENNSKRSRRSKRSSRYDNSQSRESSVYDKYNLTSIGKDQARTIEPSKTTKDLSEMVIEVEEQEGPNSKE